MAVTVAQLSVKMGADVDEAKRGVESVDQSLNKVKETASKVQNVFGNMISRITVLTGGLATSFTRVAGVAGNLGRSLLSAFQPLTSLLGNLKNQIGQLFQPMGVAQGFIGAIADKFSVLQGVVGSLSETFGIGFNASLEMTRVAFTQLLKDGTKAEAFLKDMQAFAATTPFEFPEVTSAAQKFLGMGMAAEGILPILQDISGGVSAMGGSSETIGRVTTALTQMIAKGKVSGEEMMQLAESGIQAWGILEEQTGKSKAELMDMAQKGELAVDTFLSAFHKYAQVHWGDMAAAQSQTFSGAMSTISDSINILRAKAFEPLFARVSKVAVALGNFLSSPQAYNFAVELGGQVEQVMQKLDGLVSGIQRWRKEHQDTIGAITATVGMLVQIFTSGFDGIMARVSSVSATLHNFLVVLGDMVIGAQTAHGSFERLSEPLQNLANTLAGPLQQAIGVLLQFGGQIREAIGSALEQVGPQASQAFGQIQTAVTGMIPTLTTLIQHLGPFLTVAIQSASTLVTQVLIPAWLHLGSVFSSNLLPALIPVIDWLTARLPQGVAIASQVVNGLLIPAFSAVQGIIMSILPTLLSFVGFLMDQMPAAIGIANAAWNTLFLPALQAGATLLTTVVLPILQQIVTWMMTNLPTAVAVASQIFNDVLLPVITTVGGILRDWIVPAILSLASTLLTVLPPAVAAVSELWQNQLGPALQSVGVFIATVVVPGIQQLAVILFTQVVPAIASFVGMLTQYIPVAERLGAVIMQVVVFSFQNLGNTLETLKNAFDSNFLGIRTAFEGAVNIILGGIDLIKVALDVLTGNFDAVGSDVAQFWDDIGQDSLAGAVRTKYGIETGLEGTAAIATVQFGGFRDECQRILGEETVVVASWSCDRIVEAIELGIAPANTVAVNQFGQFVDICGEVLGQAPNVAGYTAEVICQALESGLAPAGTIAVDQFGYFIDQCGNQLALAPPLAGAAGAATVGALNDGMVSQLPTLDQTIASVQDRLNFFIQMQNAMKSGVVDEFGTTLVKAAPSFRPPGGGTGGFKVPNVDYSQFIKKSAPAAGGGGGKGKGAGKGKGKGPGEEAKSAIKEAIDQTKSISDAIKSGIEALGKLGEFQVPPNLDRGIDAFASSVNAVMMKLQTVALGFKTKGLEAISNFSNAAKDVFSALDSALGVFKTLSESGDKILAAPEKLKSMTQQLAVLVVDITRQFQSMTPVWKEDAYAQVSAFADASGAVMGALSTGLDLFTDINAAMEEGVTFGSEMTGFVNQLSDSVAAVAIHFAALVPAWTELQAGSISQFAQTSGDILQTLSGGFDLFMQITDATAAGVEYTNAWVETAKSLTTGVIAVTTEFARQSPTWGELDVEINKTASLGAAIMSTLGDVVGFISTLSKANEDGVNLSADWVNTARDLSRQLLVVVTEFAAMTPHWDGLHEEVQNYAQTAGEVVQVLGPTFDLFLQMNAATEDGVTYTADWAATALEMIPHLVTVVHAFAQVTPQWDELHTQVQDFAQTSESVISALSATFDLFVKLQDMPSLEVPEQALNTVMGTLMRAIDIFRTSIGLAYEPESLAASAELADASGKLVAGVGAALDTLIKLADPNLTMPSSTAMDMFFSALNAFLYRFQGASSQWGSQVDDTVVALAENAGKIVSGAGAAIEPLTKLVDFVPPTAQTMDAFFGALTAFVVEFATRSAQWELDSMERAAEVAGYVQTVMGALGAAIDPIVKLADPEFVVPGPEIIDAFFAALGVLVTTFGARAQEWAASMTDQTVQFATGVQTVMGALGTAIQTLQSVAELAATGLDPSAIDFAVGNIALMLQKTVDLAGVVSPDQMVALQSFGGNLAALFGSLQSALNVMKGLQESGVDSGVISGVFGAFVEAVNTLLPVVSTTIDTNIGEVLAQAVAAGISISQGLAQGITEGTHFIQEAAQAAVQTAVDAAKQAAGIASPSKLFRDVVGFMMGKGVAVGITRATGLVGDAMQGIVNATASGVTMPTLPTPATVGAFPTGANAGSGGGDVNRDNMYISGDVTVTVPGVTHETMVAMRRRENLKNPGRL